MYTCIFYYGVFIITCIHALQKYQIRLIRVIKFPRLHLNQTRCDVTIFFDISYILVRQLFKAFNFSECLDILTRRIIKLLVHHVYFQTQSYAVTIAAFVTAYKMKSSVRVRM